LVFCLSVEGTAKQTARSLLGKPEPDELKILPQTALFLQPVRAKNISSPPAAMPDNIRRASIF
jgi:hypothetical protein